MAIKCKDVPEGSLFRDGRGDVFRKETRGPYVNAVLVKAVTLSRRGCEGRSLIYPVGFEVVVISE